MGRKGGPDGAEEDPGCSEEGVAAGPESGPGRVDVDGHGVGIGPEGGIVEAEGELAVPGGAGVAGSVGSGAAFLGPASPHHGVGPHRRLDRREEVLGRYDGDF